ncbi:MULTISPECIES: lipocalin-like domain-containing protein [unclassified Burkholderia]|uniref:lipocalin-like domain-containing protein n=1 Tax=unclassified Burkholderia TaxID=2613784 RepID=UPI0014223137|nr:MULTISPECIES: lipocalin-like domain-containing protein [unclassified Burkholderia]NIE60415.1 lipocalin-like domain-containing protein [Burkholderia sp. Ap-955]NIF08101.1 lipocalin-like domain-containing protein [Burkholderia sp. Ax-1735]NIG02832.1 lipocalin-like domain-containing protein [Burkholderia sp. Tr-849]
MNIRSIFRQGFPGMLLAASMIPGGASAAPSLAGTWTLVAADVQHPDGTIGRDYGADPKGLLLIDVHGNYSLQIFRSERPRFVSNDKATGTPDEFREAVLGSSTHYGKLTIDPAKHKLAFHIIDSSYPNWIGQTQTRSYQLKDGELSYRVPPRANGDIPISVWRRVD